VEGRLLLFVHQISPSSVDIFQPAPRGLSGDRNSPTNTFSSVILAGFLHQNRQTQHFLVLPAYNYQSFVLEVPADSHCSYPSVLLISKLFTMADTVIKPEEPGNAGYVCCLVQYSGASTSPQRHINIPLWGLNHHAGTVGTHL
jgi:hypothetical protein